MQIDSELIRFFHRLMEKGSPEYCSFSPYIQRLLVQLDLAHVYRPGEIIQASYYRILNSEKRDIPIQSPSLYVRRICLHLLQDLRNIYDDENLTVVSVNKSPDLFHETFPLIDVERETEVLYLALASLSESDRNVLYLRHLCGLSWLEISKALGHQKQIKTTEIPDTAQQGNNALQKLRLAYIRIHEDNN
ncbi:MAG: sigma-70 family RNA polymerase sigma factor [Cyanothece sp. SIO2G6]|nr:sigma-70 family RNA polymerase sigma factor [Cyanothece sp. SIO2G6]